jgi:hypothetical protein
MQTKETQNLRQFPVSNSMVEQLLSTAKATSYETAMDKSVFASAK